jgi:segregation and condensation protein B
LESGNNHQHIIEALLFASEKPLPPERIQAILKDITPEGIQQAIDSLNRQYGAAGHSFAIKKVAKGYRMYTLPDYSHWVKALFAQNRRERLSPQALEVLSIVAYKQPIVKGDVDRIRGVNSEGPLFTLLDRKLITIVGRKPSPGRPLLYGTTQEFLTHFGLNDVDDLPRMEELEAILKRKEPPSFAEEVYNQTLDSADRLSDENAQSTDQSKPESEEQEAEIPLNLPQESSSQVSPENEDK